MMNCLVGFPMPLKYVTLNDLGVPFSVKICFIRVILTLLPHFRRQPNVKTNEDIPILQGHLDY